MPLVVQRNEARIFSFTDSQQFSSHLLKRFSINELNQAGINVKAVPSTIVLEAENQLLARIPKNLESSFWRKDDDPVAILLHSCPLVLSKKMLEWLVCLETRINEE